MRMFEVAFLIVREGIRYMILLVVCSQSPLVMLVLHLLDRLILKRHRFFMACTIVVL